MKMIIVIYKFLRNQMMLRMSQNSLFKNHLLQKVLFLRSRMGLVSCTPLSNFAFSQSVIITIIIFFFFSSPAISGIRPKTSCVLQPWQNLHHSTSKWICQSLSTHESEPHIRRERYGVPLFFYPGQDKWKKDAVFFIQGLEMGQKVWEVTVVVIGVWLKDNGHRARPVISQSFTVYCSEVECPVHSSISVLLT